MKEDGQLGDGESAGSQGRAGTERAAHGGGEEAHRLARGSGAPGLAPVLVGGMALVVLGSRRVTRDFDFVIARPGDRLARTVGLFYDRGLELVSGLDATGGVTSTISNRRVAVARLRLDAPASASFFDPKGELRVDLRFDFPIPAAELAERATRTRIRSHRFDIAGEADLLRLKKIARAARSAPGDADDIAFLQARQTDMP